MSDAFKDYDGRKWNWYTYYLNKEFEPEDTDLNLSPEEEASYRRDLAWLKEERRKHPGIPIGYSPVEVD